MYSISKIKDYFYTKMHKNLQEKDETKKINVLKEYNIPIQIIDMTSKLAKKKNMLLLDFTYYGVYNLECVVQEIEILLKNNNFSILFIKKNCDHILCYCVDCRSYGEMVWVIAN